MQYVIFECNRTLELCTESRNAGFESWIPITITKRVTKRLGKPDVVRKIKSAAMPGYIFVPEPYWQVYRSWVPNRFFVRPMMQFTGKGDMTGPQRQLHTQPCTVGIEQLRLMDERIRVRHALPTEARPEPLALGQPVKVVFGPFDGLEGQVCKDRGEEVRLDIAGRYVTLPRIWLEPQDFACKAKVGGL